MNGSFLYKKPDIKKISNISQWYEYRKKAGDSGGRQARTIGLQKYKKLKCNTESSRSLNVGQYWVGDRQEESTRS